MTSLRVQLLAVICISMSGCGTYTNGDNSVAAAQARVAQARENMRNTALSPLWAWEQENPPSCSSPQLQKARSSVLGFADAVGSNDDLGLDVKFDTGSWILDVADSAKDHGCKDVARSLYDAVIQIFIGGGYAALRDRARIGIDDLRGLQ